MKSVFFALLLLAGTQVKADTTRLVCGTDNNIFGYGSMVLEGTVVDSRNLKDVVVQAVLTDSVINLAFGDSLTFEENKGEAYPLKGSVSNGRTMYLLALPARWQLLPQPFSARLMYSANGETRLATGECSTITTRD